MKANYFTQHDKNSQARDILEKVNQALDSKNHNKIQESEEDILELTDMASSAEDDTYREQNTVSEDGRNFNSSSYDTNPSINQDYAEKEIYSDTTKPLGAHDQDTTLNPANDASTINTTSNMIKMKEKMISDTTAHKTVELFNQLKTTVKSKIDSEAVKFKSGTMLEDVVSDLLRPHIVEWLNHNLPAIVKTCVEKEVKKLLPSEE